MLEIRLHGRGGQGAVTSAELLALAAINEGNYGQAFPSFGPERRGAPVVAFCRIDERQIKIRSNINEPDLVLVLDPSILRLVNVAEGLKENGILITNTKYNAGKIRKELGFRCKLAVVNATLIATEELGIPVTNTTMLGALLKARAVVNPDSLVEPLKKRFGRIADKNIKAFKRAFKETELDY
ncbi:MAG TPA: 2-oxoacid:acceptor oxidoreductase family protein [Desulfobacteraceae bacterium]|jgi:pyruvate ferredoxin oxidoreductase gamma subunit|nr:2-oxoacid:acceptor oxidoreductase family protein [Desulfobacteraceae bacterium]HPJ67426.1 2-oxoacid:acceptor oxidoreductase family protein [Desulfobacteraceae bacterium]HPQ28764.1 2-oxoacid:acceptor oxidoreductase family protein [Desulfobacteraceae bacterium]